MSFGAYIESRNEGCVQDGREDANDKKRPKPLAGQRREKGENRDLERELVLVFA